MSERQVNQEHAHPGVGTYLTVAAVLTIITLVEVGVFYVPAFEKVLPLDILPLPSPRLEHPWDSG